MYHVIGICNALIDLLVKVNDDDLKNAELKKGISQLAPDGKVDSILTKFTDIKTVPAGATTNTLMGIAALGGKSILIGMIGSGKYGKMFEDRITKQGVVSRLIKSNNATGKAATLVTPDAERTFAVNLGAATQLTPDAVIEKDIKDSKILYFTGYEFESVNEVIMKAVGIAKKNNVTIAMDLADPDLIQRNKEKLEELINDIDILFMNENEAKAFTGLEPKKAAEVLSKKVDIVIAKIGDQGSYVYSDSKITECKAFKTEAVDTTGAGDLFAAGFLFGMTHNKSIEESARLGSYMGSKIVEQVGALLSEKAVREITEMFG